MNMKSHRGFTLMEVVIYIGLFGILMSGAVAATYQLLQGGAKNEANIAIQEEGTFLIRKFNWALTSTSAVTVSDGNTITITKLIGPDYDATNENPLIITGQGGIVTMQRGTSAALTLNASAYPVDNFAARTDSSSGKTAVDITFSIKGIPFVFKTYLR